MRINHNIPALNAHRQLNRNSNVSAKVLERLSSGKQINRAADDAAGMAISEKMKAQISGLKKAAQNTLDGISLIQTAEGAMNEVHSMLQRMRELSVQAANGTVTDEDRNAIQSEINQLTSEVNRIANGTEFNTRSILRGNEGPNSNATVHRMSTGEAASLVTNVESSLMGISSPAGSITTTEINKSQAKVDEVIGQVPEWDTGTITEALVDSDTATLYFLDTKINITTFSEDDPSKASILENKTNNSIDLKINVHNNAASGIEDQLKQIKKALEEISAEEGSALKGFTFDVTGDPKLTITGVDNTETFNEQGIAITGGKLKIPNTQFSSENSLDGKVGTDTSKAAWDTGAITPLSDGQTGIFEFMGTEINIKSVTGHGTPTTTNISKDSIDLIVDSPVTAETLANSIAGALKDMSNISGSPITGFEFGINTDNNGVKITAPEVGTEYNSHQVTTTGDVEINQSLFKDGGKIGQKAVAAVAEVNGEYTLEITTPFRDGDVVKIDGLELSFGTDETSDININEHPTAAEQAKQIQEIIVDKSVDGAEAISQKFDIAISGSTITLKENSASGMNKPDIISTVKPSKSWASMNLSVVVEGKETLVNLRKLDNLTQELKSNTELSEAQKQKRMESTLLEAINEALGEEGHALFKDNGQLEIKTSSVGGKSEIKLVGSEDVLMSIFGTADSESLRATGKSEENYGEAKGSFYFNEVPENGSTLTIGSHKIEFYDSSVSPYTGSNIPVDLSESGTPKTIEAIVSQIKDLGIPGVDIKQDETVKNRLIVESKDSGFKGQSIYLEGTPKEFMTNLQVGPNQGQGFRLTIGDIRATKLGISSSTPDGNTGIKGAAFNLDMNVTDGLSANTIEYALDVSTEERATAAITVYNDAILQVAEMRGSLGAIQNRLEHTAANLENTSENLTAALSRIEDADMALEMSEFTKYNILIQAGTAMLAQANQRPQTILQLLGN